MSKRPAECHARQFSDGMFCGVCGMTWDVNDTEPPPCRKVDHRTSLVRAALTATKELDTPAPRRLPDELPAELALDMAVVFMVNKGFGPTSRIAAMQAAYRLLLDRMEL